MGSLFFSIFFLLKHALHFQENGKTNNNLFQQLIESNRELDCGKFNHSNGPESPRGIAYCLPMLLVDYHMALYNLDQDCLSIAVQRPPKTRPFCQHFRFMNLISFLGKCISRKKDLIESFWDIFRFFKRLRLIDKSNSIFNYFLPLENCNLIINFLRKNKSVDKVRFSIS